MEPPSSLFHLVRDRQRLRERTLSRLPAPKGMGGRRSLFRYMDFRIQMGMLAGLVLLEVGLVAAGVVFLYFRFKHHIHESLFQIHHQAGPGLAMAMLGELGWAMLWLVAANFLAVFLADRLWVGYVRRVIARFRQLSHRTGEMDFSSDTTGRASHKVVADLLAWRRAEHERLTQIRAILGHFHPGDDVAEPCVQVRYRQYLSRLREVLPPYARRFVGPVGPAEENRVVVRAPGLPTLVREEGKTTVMKSSC